MRLFYAPQDFLFTAGSIGLIAYIMVWTLQNMELTQDTIMPWADKQETFLQKVVSCKFCLGFHVTMFLTTLGCLVEGLGLVNWLAYTAVAWATFAILTRFLNLLPKQV